VNIKRESDELDVEYLMERSDELKDVCESTDLNLWISTNSWDVEGYPQEGSLEDIERLIEQAQEAASHKRLMFGHRVGYQDFDSPERFVGGIVDNLRELTEVFLLDNSFFDEAFPHVE
jgi:hypothetical protein